MSAASETIDQASLINSLLSYMGEVTGIPDLKLAQTIDGTAFIQLLFRMCIEPDLCHHAAHLYSDEDYFKQSAINISQDPIKQHGWVLNAARLKRIYLRLIGHFTFALQLDPSRLLVPDCNLLAKKSIGWEAHWLRLAALAFFALYKSDPVVKSRFHAIPVISAWIKQIEGRLERADGSPPIEFESSPPLLYSLEVPDVISTADSSARSLKDMVPVNSQAPSNSVKSVPSDSVKLAPLGPEKSAPIGSFKAAPSGTVTPPPTWPLSSVNGRSKPAAVMEVPSLYPSLEGPDSKISTSGSVAATSSSKSLSSEKAETWHNGTTVRPEPEKGDSKAKLESCKAVYEGRIQSLQAELAKCKQAEPSEDLNYIEEIAVLEIELDGTKAKLRKEADRAQRLQGLVNEQSEKIEALDYANVELRADIEEKGTVLARLEEELEARSAKDLREESKESGHSALIESPHEKIAQQVPKHLFDEEKHRAQVHADNIVVLEKMIESMDSELSEAQQMLAASAKRIRELEFEASKVQEEDQGMLVRMLEDELVRKNEALQAIQTEHNATKAQLAEALYSLAGLQTQTLSASASVSADASLQEELALKNQLVADLEEALAFERAKPYKATATHQDELAQKIKVIADLEEALSCERSKTSVAIEHAKDQLRALQKELALKTQLIVDLEEALAFERAKVSEASDSVGRSKDQLVADLEEALAYEKQNAKELRIRTEEMNVDQEKIILLQEQLKFLEQESEKRKGIIGELEAKFKSEKESSALLKETLELKEAELMLAKSSIESADDIRNQLARFKETEITLIKQVDDLHTKLQCAQKEIEDSHTRLSEIETDLAFKEEEIQALRNPIESDSSLSSLLTEKEDQIYRLESELALLSHSKVQLERLEKTLAAKDRKILELEGMLSELEEEIAELRLRLTADSTENQQSNTQNEEFEFAKNKISASIEILKQQIGEHGAHLTKLLDIQTKIDGTMQAIEVGRIVPIEKFFGSEKCDFDAISANFRKVHNMSCQADEKLQNLTVIQQKIEKVHGEWEKGRVDPLEVQLNRLKYLIQAIEAKVNDLEKQKEASKGTAKINSNEQQMILAAWHDLGLKIMKMKTAEK